MMTMVQGTAELNSKGRNMIGGVWVGPAIIDDFIFLTFVQPVCHGYSVEQSCS
jgi:hypothetical protein